MPHFPPFPATDDDPFGALPDEDQFTPAGGLVVAPLPGLPTRWDAVDGDAAFAFEPLDGGAGSGLAVRNVALDDLAFTPAPLAAVPADMPARLPVPAPQHAAPATLPATLYDEVFKVCVRLTGITSIARDLAQQAIRSASSPESPDGDPLTAMATAVELSIGCQLPADRRIPYHQHRERLRRDLARRSPRDRAILAVRHLVAMPPSGVAARLDVAESQVRETGSAWCPDDSRVDSLALLRGIDSWISSDLGSAASASTGTELDHLDEAID